MIDISKYDEFLLPVIEGLGIRSDCPKHIKAELIGIDKEYFDVYDDHLIKIEN
jgi:hypothetical protein